MNRKSSSGTVMFMIEMIFVVFFFILCASTCILIFVKANQMSSLANDTNQGVVGAESIAEVWKAEGSEGLKQRMFAESVSGPGELEAYRVFWDTKWNVTLGTETASYQGEVVMKHSVEDGLNEVQITIVRIRDRVKLFELQAKKYAESWN